MKRAFELPIRRTASRGLEGEQGFERAQYQRVALAPGEDGVLGLVGFEVEGQAAEAALEAKCPDVRPAMTQLLARTGVYVEIGAPGRDGSAPA